MAAKLFVLAVLVSVLSALPINDSTANVEIPDKISIDAITAKDTEDLFQEALKEELPGLQSMKLAQEIMKALDRWFGLDEEPEAGTSGAAASPPRKRPPRIRPPADGALSLIDKEWMQGISSDFASQMLTHVTSEIKK
jgi:hypothetical protein